MIKFCVLFSINMCEIRAFCPITNWEMYQVIVTKYSLHAPGTLPRQFCGTNSVSRPWQILYHPIQPNADFFVRAAVRSSVRLSIKCIQAFMAEFEVKSIAVGDSNMFVTDVKCYSVHITGDSIYHMHKTANSWTPVTRINCDIREECLCFCIVDLFAPVSSWRNAILRIYSILYSMPHLWNLERFPLFYSGFQLRLTFD